MGDGTAGPPPTGGRRGRGPACVDKTTGGETSGASRAAGARGGCAERWLGLGRTGRRWVVALPTWLLMAAFSANCSRKDCVVLSMCVWMYVQVCVYVCVYVRACVRACTCTRALWALAARHRLPGSLWRWGTAAAGTTPAAPRRAAPAGAAPS
jgi:hypothetical protein